MANELQTRYAGGGTAYAIIRRKTDGYVWNGVALVAWVDGNIGTYDIPLSSLGGLLYAADLPAALVGVEDLRVYFFEQSGGSPAIDDPAMGESYDIVAVSAEESEAGDIFWPTSRGLNFYAGLAEIKAKLGITGTDSDASLFLMILEASRLIDDICGRHFYTVKATRHPLVKNCGSLLLKWDLLSVDTLKTDDDGDRTYEQTWETTDYDLIPDDEFPKWKIAITPNGNYSFPLGRRTVELAGIFGYGDGLRAAPWDATGLTGTLASSSATSGTVSGAGIVQAGHTILLGTEQIFVGSVNGTTISNLVRGVNGTTAATQAGVALYLAAYPVTIQSRVRMLVQTGYRRIGTEHVSREEIERVSIEYMKSTEVREGLEAELSNFRLYSVGAAA